MKRIVICLALVSSFIYPIASTPLASATVAEFRIFSEMAENDRFDNLNAIIRPSQQPYIFWDCRESQIPGLHLYYEINNSFKNRRVVAYGSPSSSTSCPSNLPVRYDFKFNLDKKFIEQLITDKACIGSCSLNSGYLGFLESPGRGPTPWLANVLMISYSATYAELNPLPQNYSYPNQINSKSFSTGDVSAISVEHNSSSGDLRVDIKFRRAPIKKVFSVSYGSGFIPEKNGEDVVCSGGTGVKFTNFPKLKIAEDSDLTPTSVKVSKNLLSVNFKSDELKAETFREDGFKDFPNCFGISYWVTKSSYDKGNQCSGSIQSGIVNLNCTPYEGWSSWKVVGNSQKISFPPIKIE
jgi:hypothetical protein